MANLMNFMLLFFIKIATEKSVCACFLHDNTVITMLYRLVAQENKQRPL